MLDAKHFPIGQKKLGKKNPKNFGFQALYVPLPTPPTKYVSNMRAKDFVCKC
jgi:hypothetical protein